MKITIAKGVTVKEIVLEDGTPLVKVAHGLLGITPAFPFCDVQADLAEVVPQAIFTFITDHVLEVGVNPYERTVVSDTKEVFFKLVI